MGSIVALHFHVYIRVTPKTITIGIYVGISTTNTALRSKSRDWL